MSSERAAHPGTHHSIPKELDMSQARFSPRSIVMGLALTALLVVALALVVVAQEPGRSPDAIAAPGGSDPPPEAADPNATSYFLFLAASTFAPFDDTMTYVNGGHGCIYRTGGAWLMEHTVQLPQGAEISQIRLYYYDNSTIDNAAVQLYAFAGNSSSTEIVNLESTGTPGGPTWIDSAPFSYIVDNSAEALVARLDFQGSWTENIKICGVRIRYQYTPSIVDLPVILNGTSP
jgi:hypothetical protein